MDITGLALCTRYSYPPNSLSLCGPDKQEDLKWYSSNLQADKGTVEILTLFSTLYPYLKLISSQNNISDPFDPRVIEAYWIGNELLYRVSERQFALHLSDKLHLKKKISRIDLTNILNKLDEGALPNHAFHVTNIYKRTGHLEIPHSVKTMDACLVNWGKVNNISDEFISVSTQSLKEDKGKLIFQKKERKIMWQGEKDFLKNVIKKGDFISYHWGYICHKLTKSNLKNLIYYTNTALKLANLNLNI